MSPPCKAEIPAANDSWKTKKFDGGKSLIRPATSSLLPGSVLISFIIICSINVETVVITLPST